MARARTNVVEGPPRNDVYVGMLGVIAICMAVGIGLLLLDLGDYDSSEAKGGPAITLPKAGDRTPRPPAPATPPPGDADDTSPGA
jgi:hypothetical protein